VVDVLVEIDFVCFVRYHALGNDHLFLDASKFALPNVTGIKKVSHMNFEIGSNGILYGTQVNGDTFFVQILNIDGSEAEISGKGIRIFAHSMLDLGKVIINKKFSIKIQTDCNM
jgi:diaminopimelate epimerase